jgi:hypothetical protein
VRRRKLALGRILRKQKSRKAECVNENETPPSII